MPSVTFSSFHQVASDINDTDKLVNVGTSRLKNKINMAYNSSASMKPERPTPSVLDPKQSPTARYAYLEPGPSINEIVETAINGLERDIKPKDPEDRRQLVEMFFALIHDNGQKLIDKKQMSKDQALAFRLELGELLCKTGMPGERDKDSVFVPKGAGNGANPLLNPLRDLLFRQYPDILEDKASREEAFDIAEKMITATVKPHMKREEIIRFTELQRDRTKLEQRWQEKIPDPTATTH